MTRLAPMLAATAATLPTGDGYAFEPKYDGFRTIIDVAADGRCRIRSRHDRLWTDRFPELGALAARVPGPAVLDGETIVLDDRGRPSFEMLSARLAGARRRHRPATFVAFDVLKLDGQLLVDEPWSERRAHLEALELDGERAIATTVFDDGQALFDATAALGVEGIMVKRRSSRYVCGRRTTSWLKVKHRNGRFFDLIGWRPPARSRPATVVLAEDGHYAGTAMVALPAIERDALSRLVSHHGTPCDRGLSMPAGVQVWVEYTERSARGYLREAVARQLRPSYR